MQLFKKLLIALLVTVPAMNQCYGQKFATLLDEGKTSMKEQRAQADEGKTPDFSKALALLGEATKMHPDDPEAHYFLGCAIDYNSNPDGGSLNQVRLGTTFASSKEFETVINLSPRYKGELMVLDPYSKITSIWGCLAFAYILQEKHDSARWAFTEGKKRGGFSPFTLAFSRQALKNCPPGAIFFSEGDISTMCLWYLQEVENERPDVAVLSTTLIQVPWFNAYIYKKRPHLFSSAHAALDTVQYSTASEKVITVKNNKTGKSISWRLQARDGGYMYLCDNIMLDIVTNDHLEHAICFESNARPENQLGLNSFIKSRIFFDLLTGDSSRKNPELIRLMHQFPFDIIKMVNENSDIEMNYVHSLQVLYLYTVVTQVQNDKNDDAAKLFEDLTLYMPASKFPYNDEQMKTYAHKLTAYFANRKQQKK